MGECSLRSESRKDYNSEKGKGFSLGQLDTGALLRIADACELMAKDRDGLEKDLQFYKQLHDASVRMEERLNRQLAARKGQVTKLKKRVAELEGGLS